jgi:hypothetical protein
VETTVLFIVRWTLLQGVAIFHYLRTSAQQSAGAYHVLEFSITARSSYVIRRQFALRFFLFFR